MTKLQLVKERIRISKRIAELTKELEDAQAEFDRLEWNLIGK